MTRFAALRVAALSTYFHTVAGHVRWAIWSKNLGRRSISCTLRRAMIASFRPVAAWVIAGSAAGRVSLGSAEGD